MINFIVVTHGEFGAYLVEAAEGIVGRQGAGVRVLSISARVSVPEIQKRLSAALRDLGGPDGVVVFTDMPGGTPNNVAFLVVKDLPRAELVSGLNLYMLVSAFNNRDRMPLRELVDKLILDGQKSIRDIRLLVSGRRPAAKTGA